MTKHRFLCGMLPAAAAGLTAQLLLTACSSSPAAPSVAGLGAATATASASPTSTLSAYQQGLAFSACMRSHGVTNFPDPKQGGTGGGIQISGSGINAQSPAFQAAISACKKLMPAGKAGGKTPFDASKVPAWSACIRSHGVPDFPDPKVTSAGLQIVLTDIADKAAFKSAMQACQSKYPGGGMSVITGSGSGSGVTGGGS